MNITLTKQEKENLYSDVLRHYEAWVVNINKADKTPNFEDRNVFIGRAFACEKALSSIAKTLKTIGLRNVVDELHNRFRLDYMNNELYFQDKLNSCENNQVCLINSFFA